MFSLAVFTAVFGQRDVVDIEGEGYVRAGRGRCTTGKRFPDHIPEVEIIRSSSVRDCLEMCSVVEECGGFQTRGFGGLSPITCYLHMEGDSGVHAARTNGAPQGIDFVTSTCYLKGPGFVTRSEDEFLQSEVERELAIAQRLKRTNGLPDGVYSVERILTVGTTCRPGGSSGAACSGIRRNAKFLVEFVDVLGNPTTPATGDRAQARVTISGLGDRPVVCTRVFFTKSGADLRNGRSQIGAGTIVNCLQRSLPQQTPLSLRGIRYDQDNDEIVFTVGLTRTTSFDVIAPRTGDLSAQRRMSSKTGDQLERDFQAGPWMNALEGLAPLAQQGFQSFFHDDVMTDGYDEMTGDSPISGGDGHIPRDSILCPGKNEADYCDCTDDCTDMPQFCTCQEAKSCCQANGYRVNYSKVMDQLMQHMTQRG